MASKKNKGQGQSPEFQPAPSVVNINISATAVDEEAIRKALSGTEIDYEALGLPEGASKKEVQRRVMELRGLKKPKQERKRKDQLTEAERKEQLRLEAEKRAARRADNTRKLLEEEKRLGLPPYTLAPRPKAAKGTVTDEMKKERRKLRYESKKVKKQGLESFFKANRDKLIESGFEIPPELL